MYLVAMQLARLKSVSKCKQTDCYLTWKFAEVYIQCQTTQITLIDDFVVCCLAPVGWWFILVVKGRCWSFSDHSMARFAILLVEPLFFFHNSLDAPTVPFYLWNTFFFLTTALMLSIQDLILIHAPIASWLCSNLMRWTHHCICYFSMNLMHDVTYILFVISSFQSLSCLLTPTALFKHFILITCWSNDLSWTQNCLVRSVLEIYIFLLQNMTKSYVKKCLCGQQHTACCIPFSKGDTLYKFMHIKKTIYKLKIVNKIRETSD